LNTGDTGKYIYNWFEINNNLIGTKWFYCKKGGAFRKWYGNNGYVILWENDGIVIKTQTNSYIRNESHYFHTGVEWTKITSYKIGVRWFPDGYIFDDASCALFLSDSDKTCYILGLLNSALTNDILLIINPTLNYTNGAVSHIPVIYKNEYLSIINNAVAENISISHSDWDSFETSWDFKRHPLVQYSRG
jgi:hypothetical protein